MHKLRICHNATFRLLIAELAIYSKLKLLGARNTGTSVLNLDRIQHGCIIRP